MSNPSLARLLVVDDIGDNRDLLKRRLGRLGYDVAEADDGVSALELIARQPFDLILLDIMMPGIDGMEVLRRIRLDHTADALPVVMVTAKTTGEDVAAALELGANDYLTKPVDMAVAKARVAAQVGRKRAQDAAREVQTRLEHTVERLRAAMTVAETASRTRSDTLAEMSSDIRSSLDGLVIAAAALGQGCTPGQEQMVRTVAQSVGALERSLADVLDAAHGAPGQREIRDALFDLGEVIEHTARRA